MGICLSFPNMTDEERNWHSKAVERCSQEISDKTDSQGVWKFRPQKAIPYNDTIKLWYLLSNFFNWALHRYPQQQYFDAGTFFIHILKDIAHNIQIKNHTDIHEWFFFHFIHSIGTEILLLLLHSVWKVGGTR